jgi:hypothetical protein
LQCRSKIADLFGLRKQDIGRFGLVVTPIGSISSQMFVVPWIKRVGNQRAFQTGCLAGAVGWTLCGQCWRLFGVATRAGVYKTGAVYVMLYIANLFGSGWPGAPAACQHSIRAMVLAQGIAVTDAGKGELNAAYGGLGLSIGVVMPYLLCSTYMKFTLEVVAGFCAAWFV